MQYHDRMLVIGLTRGPGLSRVGRQGWNLDSEPSESFALFLDCQHVVVYIQSGFRS